MISENGSISGKQSCDLELLQVWCCDSSTQCYIIFEFQICADVLESVSFWRLAQIFKTQAYISHNASKL